MQYRNENGNTIEIKRQSNFISFLARIDCNVFQKSIQKNAHNHYYHHHQITFNRQIAAVFIFNNAIRRPEQDYFPLRCI